MKVNKINLICFFLFFSLLLYLMDGFPSYLKMNNPDVYELIVQTRSLFDGVAFGYLVLLGISIGLTAFCLSHSFDLKKKVKKDEFSV